jgi:hypothetical protein
MHRGVVIIVSLRYWRWLSCFEILLDLVLDQMMKKHHSTPTVMVMGSFGSEVFLG